MASYISITPNLTSQDFAKLPAGIISRKDLFRNIAGAGLGLSICRELAQVLEGKLEIESVVDKGTRAIITLPILNKQILSDSI
jgi:signal transduction histidine kinase